MRGGKSKKMQNLWNSSNKEKFNSVVLYTYDNKYEMDIVFLDPILLYWTANPSQQRKRTANHHDLPNSNWANLLL